MLERVSPDVISLDIRLPGMDGFEATRRIMRDKPTPIVVCSASVESDELKITMNALRAGALAVVEKPVGDDPRRLRGAGPDAVHAARDHERGEGRAPAHVLFLGGPSAGDLIGRATPSRLFAVGNPGCPLRVLGIGASTGGPNAVVQVLTDLAELSLCRSCSCSTSCRPSSRGSSRGWRA